jgi:hypothetical protein
MRALVQFIKRAMVAAKSLSPPADSIDMTLHDAIRLCHGRARVEPAHTRQPDSPIGVCRYRSEGELREQWRKLENCLPAGAKLTVVLQLDDQLRTSPRELVRRRNHADRLVIVPRAGHWPWTESLGDLALASVALGWSSIEGCRDLGHAIDDNIATLEDDRRLYLVLPSRG